MIVEATRLNCHHLIPDRDTSTFNGYSAVDLLIMNSVRCKVRERRFIVSHQRSLHFRPTALLSSSEPQLILGGPIVRYRPSLYE